MYHKTLVVGPFRCNCRIFVCTKTYQALIVDPGDEPDLILSSLAQIEQELGVSLRVSFLLHTHAHLDHVGATRAIKVRLKKSQIALHAADLPLYLQLKHQGKLFGIELEDPLPVEHFLEDEEILSVGELKLSVLHTPGHSPGSVCFRLHENSMLGIQESLLTGDTLFYDSVGRTDLLGGNQNQLFRSIQNRILSLEDEIKICPGHGKESTIGRERRFNPFLASH